ncbi:hypothetical protein FB45DRAFT_464155 [Roridomyces roridus]|uniref:Uncharacterized protein n=1 Tax=Roridomyces roridus TaxID=1738132 RepID=A0AAD7AZM2_9AGAR|nr:hypothetical protein FB45DRAFT_371853 [Roridomyces roridus]KAJ7605761.1 hypothetical protein FB45DRAFT_464155 [Roridomyces roridus]
MSFSPNITHTERFKEEAWLQGSMLSCLAYGIEMTLFFVCTYYSLHREPKPQRGGSTAAGSSRTQLAGARQIYLLYSTIMFLLGTLYMSANAKYLSLSYITNRNFPGGPSAFQDNMLSAPIAIMGNVCFAAMTWLASALMIWRCAVVYADCQYPMFMILCLPCTLLGVSVAIGTVWLVQVSDSMFPHPDFILVFLSVSLALGVVLAILISGRILVVRQQVAHTGYSSPLTGMTAILIESASMYCALCLVCVVTIATGTPLSRLFLQSLGHVHAITTFLIIFRDTRGDSWTMGTVTRLMHPSMGSTDVKLVSFGTSRGTTSQQQGVLVTREVYKAGGGGQNSSVKDVVSERGSSLNLK